MRIAFFALFAQLSCILVYSIAERDFMSLDEIYGGDISFDHEKLEFNEYNQVLQMLEKAKKLGTGFVDRTKDFSNRRYEGRIELNHLGRRPGVDYFRKGGDVFTDGYPRGGHLIEDELSEEVAMARPVKRQAPAVPPAEEIKEEHLLAFIVKEKYKDNKCKEELEKYCEELKKADENFKVNDKVKGLCEKGKQEDKCKELKAKVEAELKALEEGLEDASVDDVKDEEVCKKYEEKCILLEETGYSDDIKNGCPSLREKCYKLKRKKVAEELLFRALGGDVKDNECKEKVKAVCSVLSRESDELMSFCLDPTKTCETLKEKLKDLCEPLKTKLAKDLEKDCHERLEKCHFYKEACDDSKCDEDKKQCEGKGIIYKAPESDFSPVKPKASLLRSIGLEDVYKRAEKDGIIIGKVGVDLPRRFGDDFLQDFLLLLGEDENDAGKKPEEKCTKALEKCDASKHLDDNFKELCDDGKNKNEKCKKLLNVEERCTHLKLNLYLKDLSTEYDKESKLLFWRELPTLFTKGECAELESECFYLKKACKDSKIDEACQNARAACYKKGQYRMLNTHFREVLKGKPDDLKYYNIPEICKKSVVENCKKLDKKYLPQCLYPKELCYLLSDDVFLQSKELGVLLDDRRDFPFEKDCFELEEKCDELETYSFSNSEKCVTLKRRCEYFDVTEGFRNVLLKRKDHSLYNEQNCTEVLQEKCNTLYRKRKNPFKVSCALPEETCKYMVHHTSQDCRYLKVNIRNEGIVEEIKKANANKNETTLEELCTTWGRHCHQLMENCPDDLKKKENGNDNDHNCEKLDEKCSDTFKRLKLEEELTHLLKGSLKDKDECKKTLEKRCTELQNNETFKNLLSYCGENDKGTVCEKLVEKLKKRCPTLKDGLNKAKDELTKMKKEYDALKKAAEESTKEASLLLSRPRQTVMPSAQNGSASEQVLQPVQPESGSSSGSPSSPPGPPSAPPQNGTPATPGGAPGTPSSGTTGPAKLGLVKRAYVAEGVSEAEVKAFDATTIALELYLELKEECKALELDCGFKEDCKETEPACKEIEKLCKLEALKVAPHHTETITNKVTETQTETKTVEKVDDKADVKTVEKTVTVTKPGSGEKVTEECTMIQTTDTWVTSTSLHTSTTTSTSTVTSTVTLTSMRKCKPTKCTTDSSRETDKGGEGEEDVKPNEGMKIRVPDMIKIMLLGVIVMGMM